MKSVTVKLQEGLVVVETDATKPVLPSALWKEILRVGFLPERMEAWATGTFDGRSFGRWTLVNEGPGSGERRARFKIVDGAEDPPNVEFVE